jgi:glycosyltransferase involved in cell wall biosynthesis
MPDRPLIAVVVPAYNLAAFLGEALGSIVAQRLPADAMEIVLVDDGSTDETPAVAACFAPRVRYVHQQNRGLPAARNRGASETTAPYLSFLDADDRFLPDKLEAELRILEVKRTIDVAYSGWHYIDEAGARLPQHGWSRDEGDVLERLLLGNIIHPHAATLRRSTFATAGGFDESLTSVEDWDLWIRVSLNGARWATVARPALEYRVRHDGMHANPGRMLENRLRVLDKTFARVAAERPDLLRARAAAYRNAHLEAACDWARKADVPRAIASIRAAACEAPAFLSSSRGLREICRLLLPLGHRNDDEVVRRWTDLGPLLRTLVIPAADDQGAGTRLRCEAALIRLGLRYRRKRVRPASRQALA